VGWAREIYRCVLPMKLLTNWENSTVHQFITHRGSKKINNIRIRKTKPTIILSHCPIQTLPHEDRPVLGHPESNRHRKLGFSVLQSLVWSVFKFTTLVSWRTVWNIKSEQLNNLLIYCSVKVGYEVLYTARICIYGDQNYTLGVGYDLTGID